MIKVSVIVPAYNVEDYIEKCLESLVNQTLEEIEIIVVNDGSKDSTKQKIDKFLEKHPEKIKYLEKSNGGLSDARNYGIPYAQGEYIGFVDSDDYVETNMFEDMYKKAKEENSDMVECDFIWEYPKVQNQNCSKTDTKNSKELKSATYHCKQKLDIGKIYNNKKEAFIYARVVAWNKIIKRETLQKSNIWFPKGLRYEDTEFFYKLLPSLNKISFVKVPMVHYIQRSNSIANTQNERVKEIFDIWENIFKFYKENNLFEEYENEIEYTYARFLLCSSLLRIVKVKDKTVRKELEERTWKELNTKFPAWQQNPILKQEKGSKNTYMKLVNSNNFKIFCKMFGIL